MEWQPFVQGCELLSTPVPCFKLLPIFQAAPTSPLTSLDLPPFDPTSPAHMIHNFNKCKTTLAHWNSSWSDRTINGGL
jgi:hypothetical protein